MRQNTLTVKRLLEHFMKKFAKDKLKRIQKRKSKKKKVTNYMSIRKVMKTCLITGYIKKRFL